MRGRELARKITGQAAPVALFHVAPFTGWTPARAALAMGRIVAPTIALPLGAYAGEDVLLREAARASGSWYPGLLAADDVTALIAGCGCIVSTSMHAAIVGTCFGRPVIVPGIEENTLGA